MKLSSAHWSHGNTTVYKFFDKPVLGMKSCGHEQLQFEIMAWAWQYVLHSWNGINNRRKDQLDFLACFPAESEEQSIAIHLHLQRMHSWWTSCSLSSPMSPHSCSGKELPSWSFLVPEEVESNCPMSISMSCSIMIMSKRSVNVYITWVATLEAVLGARLIPYSSGWATWL